MRDRTFLDTNLLGYAADENSSDKMKKAQQILVNLTREGTPVISTQVLQEFYNIATKKLHIAPLQAKILVHTFSKMETVALNTQTIENAIDISMHNQLSFWDSLIIAAAESAHCSIILSEDLNDGQIICGIRIVNPFK
jgi:predicted nucleic acid-binding protein